MEVGEVLSAGERDLLDTAVVELKLSDVCRERERAPLQPLDFQSRHGRQEGDVARRALRLERQDDVAVWDREHRVECAEVIHPKGASERGVVAAPRVLPVEVRQRDALADPGAENADVWRQPLCLGLQEVVPRPEDKDEVLGAVGREVVVRMTVETLDPEALEPVPWQCDVVDNVTESESLKAREKGEVGRVFAGCVAVPDLDDAVGEAEQLGGEVVEVQKPNDERRDRVGEGDGRFQVRHSPDNHRVDVGEELDGFLWRVEEREGGCLEGAHRFVAALRGEEERLDGLGITDEEDDVGKVDGLKTNCHIVCMILRLSVAGTTV